MCRVLGVGEGMRHTHPIRELSKLIYNVKNTEARLSMGVMGRLTGAFTRVH